MAKVVLDSFISTLDGRRTEDFEPRELQNKTPGHREVEARGELIAYAHVQKPTRGSEFRPLGQFTKLPPLAAIPLNAGRGKGTPPLARDHPAVVEAVEKQRIALSLNDNEADEDESSLDRFRPDGTDRREIAERQIRLRRGQQRFRRALRHRYKDQCLVTKCPTVAVLEAAHISPHRGEKDNHVEEPVHGPTVTKVY